MAAPSVIGRFRFYAESCGSIALAAEASHRQQPLLAPPGIRRFHQADQGGANRPDPAEAEDVALQGLEAVGSEVPAIDQDRHAHRNHDSRRSPVQALLPETL